MKRSDSSASSASISVSLPSLAWGASSGRARLDAGYHSAKERRAASLEERASRNAGRLTTGENRYRGLGTARDLFPLETGDNLILVQVTGAGSTTTASVEYHPEWLTC